MTIATTAMRVMEVVRGINSDTHNHEVKKIRIKGRLLWRDPNVRLSEIRQAVLNRTTISVSSLLGAGFYAEKPHHVQ